MKILKCEIGSRFYMKTRMEEICSSYEGKVEEIFVNESSYVYEWEKLNDDPKK